MSKIHSADNDLHLTRRRYSNPWFSRSILFLLFVGYLFLAYWLLVGQFYKKSKEAYISGNLVKIVPQTYGYVTDIFVKENDLVVKGQPIASIDNANAYSMLKNAETNLVELIQEISNKYQTLNALQEKAATAFKIAEEKLKKNQENYQKHLSDYNNKLISLEELKKSQLSVEKSVDSLEKINDIQDKVMSLSIDLNIYQDPTIQNAMEQLRSAYLNWIQSTVYAPETGYIVSRTINTGEKVNPNTSLITMVPINQMWVNAEVKETDLKNIRNGQQVKLTSNIYGDNVTYTGIVIGIDADNSELFTKPSPIRIYINPEQLAKHPLRFGLAMNATIDIHNNKTKSLTKLKDIPTLFETKDYREQIEPADQLIDKIVRDNTKNIKIDGTYLGSLSSSIYNSPRVADKSNEL